ncbi:hypothetical protein FQA39_LY12270 [Lamprigera yunnana]|nr:hypothetical protein FQA39_LY12270 [Lamprigera yunnana]
MQPVFRYILALLTALIDTLAKGYAWVTLATNDSYSLGALVLAHSLKQVGTVHQLAVLVTPGVTGVMRKKLASIFDLVKEVNILDSQDEANLRLLKRPELGVTFTKLHCWRLTQFDKCVFLDADTLVLANADELFDKEEFSAAPDVGWPDCFNSGVFVYRPSEDTYSKLVQFAIEKGSFDGGDQGLLNLYFSDWAHKDISKHLPFIYNMCSTACYSYLPAFKQFGGNVKIIHFIGNTKPWLQYFDSQTQSVQVVSDIQHLQVVVQQWWNIFCSHIHSTLSPEMSTSRAPSIVQYPIFNAASTFHHDPPPLPPPKDSFLNKKEIISDYRHFDPWDEYETNLDDLESRTNTSHIEQIPNVDSNVSDLLVENSYLHHMERIDQNVVVDEFCPSTNSNNDDNVPSNDNSINISHNYCYVEPQFDSNINSDIRDFHFSNNHPSHESHQSHNEPSFKPSSPEIIYSQTTVDPAPECNQLARPHMCEPTISVTNESALHDHPNEVHDGSAGLAGAFARLTLGEARSPEQALLEDQIRRQGWEVGNIDYMGRDSFDNIWSKICETLNAGPQTPVSSHTPSPPSEQPSPSIVAPEQEVVKQVVSECKQDPILTVSEQIPVAEIELPKSIDEPIQPKTTVTSQQTTSKTVSTPSREVVDSPVVETIESSITSVTQSTLPTVDSSVLTLSEPSNVDSTPQSTLSTVTVDSPVVTPLELPDVKPTATSEPQPALSTVTVDSPTVTPSELPDVKPAPALAPQPALTTATVDSPIVTPTELSGTEPTVSSIVSTPQSTLPTATVGSPIVTPAELPDVKPIVPSIVSTPQSALPSAIVGSPIVSPTELPIVPSVVSTPQSALPSETVSSPKVSHTELPIVEPIVPSVVSTPQSALPTATIDSSTVTPSELPDVKSAASSVASIPQCALSTATVDSPTVTPSEVSKQESIPPSELSSPQSPLPTATVGSAVIPSEPPKVESIKDSVTLTSQAPTVVTSPEPPKIESAPPTVTTSETSKVETIKTPIPRSESSEPIPPPTVKQVVVTQPPPPTSEGPKLKSKPEIPTKITKELSTAKSTSDSSQKVAESQPSPEKEPKTPETPKPSSTPTTKSKKDAKQSASSQSPQGSKPPANVPKLASEQAVAQKSTPQSSAQTKPETPASPEGPVPPPRKAAAATAGTKKSAKGKK